EYFGIVVIENIACTLFPEHGLEHHSLEIIDRLHSRQLPLMRKRDQRSSFLEERWIVRKWLLCDYEIGNAGVVSVRRISTGKRHSNDGIGHIIFLHESCEKLLQFFAFILHWQVHL